MESPASLSRELVDLVAVLKRIIRREFKAESGANAPTLTQFGMLDKIRQGVCHVGTLSEALGISQPATSIMINALVEGGFLKRVPHATDRRQIELHLSAKAIRHLETGFERAFAAVDLRLASLPVMKRRAIAKQIHQLSRLLSRPEG